MAKTKEESTKVTKVEEKSTAVVATGLEDMFQADAGQGLENIGREDTKIPFLKILQALSPEIDEGRAEFIEGAKAGMIFNTVTRELYEGKEGVLVIPVHFEKKYIRWRKRTVNGGGFLGEYNDRESGLNELNEETEELIDTANHFVLARTEDSWTPAVLSCTSTKLGASRSWNAMMQSVQFKGKNGPYNPPSYACIYNITTVRQQNDKGTFFNIAVERVGVVQDVETFTTAKEFRKILLEGDAKLNYDAATEAGAGPMPEGEPLPSF